MATTSFRRKSLLVLLFFAFTALLTIWAYRVPVLSNPLQYNMTFSLWVRARWLGYWLNYVLAIVNVFGGLGTCVWANKQADLENVKYWFLLGGAWIGLGIGLFLKG